MGGPGKTTRLTSPLACTCIYCRAKGLVVFAEAFGPSGAFPCRLVLCSAGGASRGRLHKLETAHQYRREHER